MTQSNENEHTFSLEHTFAFILMRLWLGARALFTGIEKFSATVNVETPLLDDMGNPDPSGIMLSIEQKVYGISHYHGMPASLSEKLSSEPFLPGFLLVPYEFILGPLLIILGITLLMGVATRISLMAMGLLYTSLTFGLILIKQDGGIAWLAVHVIMIVLALMLVKHNRFSLLKKF